MVVQDRGQGGRCAGRRAGSLTTQSALSCLRCMGVLLSWELTRLRGGPCSLEQMVVAPLGSDTGFRLNPSACSISSRRQEAGLRFTWCLQQPGGQHTLATSCLSRASTAWMRLLRSTGHPRMHNCCQKWCQLSWPVPKPVRGALGCPAPRAAGQPEPLHRKKTPARLGC